LICLIDAGEPFPGLQHAFLAWLVEARSRLTVVIKVGCSTPDFTEFSFALANPVLVGSLATCGDLVISAEALWLDHLFRPLEDCINTKLGAAWAVALYRTDHGGSTWARLVSASEPLDFPTYVVPLA
jgi:hypothetical protein